MGILDLFFEKPKPQNSKPGEKPLWTLLDVFFERPKPEPKAKK